MYYVHITDKVYPNIPVIVSLAGDKRGALLAVNGLDSMEYPHTMQPSLQEGPWEYLFSLEASSLSEATTLAKEILALSDTETDQARYDDLSQLLLAYPYAEWRRALKATLSKRDDKDGPDLLIFVQPESSDDMRGIFYYGDAGEACLDLLRRYTSIQIV